MVENEILFALKCFQLLSVILFLWLSYFWGLYRAYKAISKGKDNIINSLHDKIEAYKSVLEQSHIIRKNEFVLPDVNSSTCPKCGCQIYSPFDDSTIIHDIKKCGGIVHKKGGDMQILY